MGAAAAPESVEVSSTSPVNVEFPVTFTASAKTVDHLFPEVPKL